MANVQVCAEVLDDVYLNFSEVVMMACDESPIGRVYCMIVEAKFTIDVNPRLDFIYVLDVQCSDQWCQIQRSGVVFLPDQPPECECGIYPALTSCTCEFTDRNLSGNVITGVFKASFTAVLCRKQIVALPVGEA